MRTANASLQSFLSSKRPYWVADLFIIALTNGTTLRLTSTDQALVVGSHTFDNTGIAVQRDKITMTNTAEVPEVELKLFADDTVTIAGSPAKLFIHNGGFDGAKLTLKRAFMPQPQNVSLGTITMFIGRTSTVKLTGSGATISFKGENVVWNQYFPRNCYQSGCLHTLYDSGCTLVQASFTITKTVHAGTTAGQIVWGGPVDAGDYTLGVMTFTDGAAVGITRTVLYADTSAIAPAYPLSIVPATGDHFTISKGCDKTIATCTTRFANQVNNRSFPYIPSAYTAF